VVVDAEYRTLVNANILVKAIALRPRRRLPARLTELCPAPRVADPSRNEEAMMGKGLLLWLLGVPIPVIILLWLFFGH
jgi:hypothetical protein